MGRRLGCAVEQAAGPVHPAHRDVEVAAGEPRQGEVDGLHRRRRRVGAGQLGEHALGDADRFLAPAQPPGGRGQRVQVVGTQRNVVAGPHKGLVGGMPVPPDVRAPRRHQQIGVRVYTDFHLDRFYVISDTDRL